MVLLSNKNDIPEKSIHSILYRPFDRRFITYDSKVVTRTRTKVMKHLIINKNLGLITTRQVTNLKFNHVFCTTHLIELKVGSHDRSTNIFPLYLYTNSKNSSPSLFDTEEQPKRVANFDPAFINEFTKSLGLKWLQDGKGDLVATFGPEDVFHYAYAVFHSPIYRERYAEFLKIDFPRLPLTSDQALFRTLVELGAQLVDLHLLRLPGAGGVGGAGGAKILQSPGKQGMSFPTGGSSTVEKITYVAPLDEQSGEVRINATQKFTGVEPETWAMQIGGYQPLEKWLKDRKGRTLSTDDISHYMRMVIALRETRRLMGEIDAVIPAWPLE